jgi:hypothetical protein
VAEINVYLLYRGEINHCDHYCAVFSVEENEKLDIVDYVCFYKQELPKPYNLEQ